MIQRHQIWKCNRSRNQGSYQGNRSELILLDLRRPQNLEMSDMEEVGG